MSVSIKFLGAAETVTGSSYLVKSGSANFLVDCGMFQGKDVESRNNEEFAFDPKTVDFVVITHAHIDHIGLLPKLIRAGFNGPIFLTTKTAAVAYHLLLDAAKIQENNLQRGISSKVLYDTPNALKTIELFDAKGYESEFNSKGVKMVFEVVGHVLGAASLKAEIEGKTIYFSGDIGRTKHPFIESFNTTRRSADVVVMEALYGGEVHPDREKTEEEFIEYINETLNRDGNVIIPAFALQRTQEILNILKMAYRDNRIAKKVPIFLDSPLAIHMTNEYTQSVFANGISGSELFGFDKVRFVMKANKAIAKMKEAKIVIAGSGMCEGGRILGHLTRNLSNPKNSVAMVGFQAEDTLGRLLTENPSEVTINQKEVKVRANIRQFFGFSAHGDTNDIQSWLDRFEESNLEKVFLVHAEPSRMERFREINASKPIYIPEWKEEVQI